MGNKGTKASRTIPEKPSTKSKSTSKNTKKLQKNFQTDKTAEIFLTSSIFPEESQNEHESVLPSRDCWIEICLFLITKPSSILNLCLTHKFTGRLLYDEYFWQRLSYPEDKGQYPSWKEFFVHCEVNITFPNNLSGKDLSKIEIKGIVNWIATRPPLNEDPNPVKSRRIALFSDTDKWYSITKTSSEDRYLLYAGAQPISFPSNSNTGLTLCSDTQCSLIYDFGPQYSIVPTHIVWYCDFDPVVWFQPDHITAFCIDEKGQQVNLVKKKIPTKNRHVLVIQCNPCSPFRLLKLRNSSKQTLISGIEIFGKVKSSFGVKNHRFEFADPHEFYKDEKLGYLSKRGFPLYKDHENMWDGIARAFHFNKSESSVSVSTSSD